MLFSKSTQLRRKAFNQLDFNSIFRHKVGNFGFCDVYSDILTGNFHRRQRRRLVHADIDLGLSNMDGHGGELQIGLLGRVKQLQVWWQHFDVHARSRDFKRLGIISLDRDGVIRNGEVNRLRRHVEGNRPFWHLNVHFLSRDIHIDRRKRNVLLDGFWRIAQRDLHFRNLNIHRTFRQLKLERFRLFQDDSRLLHGDRYLRSRNCFADSVDILKGIIRLFQ
mmetsp:Transcript_17680/g.30437  ORF Transcript_17680/g.30437 Transcript_17680/m.30437 type:complete len:221 (-) Transcript_17680:1545-2207(-)